MVFKALAKYQDFVLIPAHLSVGGRKGRSGSWRSPENEAVEGGAVEVLEASVALPVKGRHTEKETCGDGGRGSQGQLGSHFLVIVQQVLFKRS